MNVSSGTSDLRSSIRRKAHSALRGAKRLLRFQKQRRKCPYRRLHQTVKTDQVLSIRSGPFAQLPPELVILIFSFLCSDMELPPSYIVSLRLTCRVFSAFLQDLVFRRKIIVHHPYQKKRFPACLLSYVRSASIVCVEWDDYVEKIIGNAINLRSLKLLPSRTQDLLQVSQLVSYQSLTHLSISLYIQAGLFFNDLASWTSLKHFHLFSIEMVFPDCTQLASNLISLSITCLEPYITDTSRLSNYFANSFQSLQYLFLDFRSTQVLPTFVSSCSENLKYLWIHNGHQTKPIPRCPNLQGLVLDLFVYHGNRHDYLDWIEATLANQNSPSNLRTLSLYSMQLSSFTGTAESLRLEDLTLRDCRDISVTFVNMLARDTLKCFSLLGITFEDPRNAIQDVINRSTNSLQELRTSFITVDILQTAEQCQLIALFIFDSISLHDRGQPIPLLMKSSSLRYLRLPSSWAQNMSALVSIFDPMLLPNLKAVLIPGLSEPFIYLIPTHFKLYSQSSSELQEEISQAVVLSLAASPPSFGSDAYVPYRQCLT